jgi:hypothetical protein
MVRFGSQQRLAFPIECSWRVYALLRGKCGFFACAFGQPEVRHAGGSSHAGNYSIAETAPELIEKRVVALVREVYR